jgi:hypothetical protein
MVCIQFSLVSSFIHPAPPAIKGSVRHFIAAPVSKVSKLKLFSCVMSSEGSNFHDRRTAAFAVALSLMTLFTPSKPVFARKPEGDDLIAKISSAKEKLEVLDKLIDDQKWTDARKKIKEIDVELRAGVIMPLSRSVGRKVKGIVEMQSILFEDFLELEKCCRSKQAECAKVQVERVRSVVNQLLGLEEKILDAL